jgi:hypothetical protein
MAKEQTLCQGWLWNIGNIMEQEQYKTGAWGLVLCLLLDDRDSVRERIFIGSCCTILSNDMKMHCIFQRVISGILTQRQCNSHMRISCELFNMVGIDLDFSVKAHHRWQNMVFPVWFPILFTLLHMKISSVTESCEVLQNHSNWKVMFEVVSSF